MCFFSAPTPPAQPQVVTVPAAAPAPAVSAPPAPTTSSGGGGTTVIEKTIEAPQEQDKDIAETKRRERKRIAERKASNDTLVTGGSGLTDSASTGAKELLGA